MTDTVRYSVADDIATITMNRPERRNAFSVEMGDGLLNAFERAEADQNVRAIILTGAGGNFSVGRDNSEGSNDPQPRPVNPSALRTKLMRFTRLVTFMYEMNTPTIAELRGGCAGAGFSLAMGCDFRYASTDAVVNTAFINVAFAGDLGSCWLLTHAVGPTRARELMMLSPKLRGPQIKEYGIASVVAPPEELSAAVRATALQLARSAPVALAATRRNLQAALTMSLGDYLPQEADQLVRCAASQDAEEARLAFIEKRPPQFGRHLRAAS